MSNITFDQYDRITDNIFWFDQNITMSFTVGLSRRSKDGGRIHFHYETEVPSKYIGVQKSRSIKRSMSYYFTIDNRRDFANGFILRQQDVYMLCHIIESQILPWFFDLKKRIFSIIKDGDDEKLIISEYKPVIYAQENNRYLKLEPIICTFTDESVKEGIRLTLNSESEYVDMDIDKFLGFYAILSKTDMYAVACSMINYAKMPPHGLNIYRPIGLGGGISSDNWSSSEDVLYESSSSSNNGIAGSGNGSGKSFLDNIGRK